MPLEGLRWSRDSGSALYDTPQNGRSRTGWGGIPAKQIGTTDKFIDKLIAFNCPTVGMPSLEKKNVLERMHPEWF